MQPVTDYLLSSRARHPGFARLNSHHNNAMVSRWSAEAGDTMESAVSPPKSAISFLKELGADTIAHHANRNLLEHLIATYELLAGWHHEQAVALAGLMHSVYGTAAFETACLAPSERGRVRAIVGERAERLAFLFSAMERDQFLDTLGSNLIVSRFGDGTTAVSDADTRIMCEILFANELDLAIAKKGADRPDKIEKKLGPVFKKTAEYLSTAARNAYRDAIGRKPAGENKSAQDRV
ncbi:MAG: DUF6817 domain-containing protein [Methyloligellaceae bacterium]